MWCVKVTQWTKLSKLYVETSLEMCAFHNFALYTFTVHLRDKADILTNSNGENIPIIYEIILTCY